jgi:hypothetical protein
LTCPPGFPSRQISSVLPKLYIHIGKKERHIQRGGHRIIPILNVRALPFINVCKIAQNKKQNRSYICFRRREIKTVRKIRASQATSGAYTLYAFGESKEPQRAFKHGSEQSETTNNATDWRIAFTEARYQQRRSEWNQWTTSVSPTNTPARTSSANDTQQNDTCTGIWPNGQMPMSPHLQHSPSPISSTPFSIICGLYPILVYSCFFLFCHRSHVHYLKSVDTYARVAS